VSTAGPSVKFVSRELGVTERTYYRWRREYGGMKVSQARRLKELEQENAVLKTKFTPELIKEIEQRVRLA
jgi:putative transposase